MRSLLLAALAMLASALRAIGSVPEPDSASRPGPWEDYVLHVATTLRSQQLTGLHFLCQSDSCVSTVTLRRLEEQITLAYTISVGGKALSSWPVSTKNLFVLVGSDCNVLAGVTLHTRDVVVMTFATHIAVESRAARAFESCWRMDILDAVGVVDNEDGVAVRVYTYLPYHPGQCHDMRPRLVAQWTPRSPQHPAALGLAGKVRDLGGCPLRVTVTQARPWTDLVPVNASSGFILRGTYAPFLSTLEKVLNFTSNLTKTTDGKMYGNAVDFPHFGGLLGDVFHNRSDFSLVFSPSDMQMPYHGRPPTAQMTCTTWCLPTGYRQASVWQPVVGEFAPYTWMAVLISYVVAAISHRFLCKTDGYLGSMLAALQSLLGSSGVMPADWAPRSFVFCWSFSGFVLATLYVAALKSINTSETVDTLFRTVQDLSESTLPMYASTDQFRNFKTAQYDDAEMGVMARAHTFEYYNAVSLFRRFFAKPDRGILTDRNACQTWALMFTPPRKAPRFHVIRNYCFTVSMANNLLLRRRSPLLQPFSAVTSRLDEAGLTKHWFDSHALKVAQSPDPVMRMQELVPFLNVLGIGLSAACIAFLLEVLVAGFFKWCISPGGALQIEV